MIRRLTIRSLRSLALAITATAALVVERAGLRSRCSRVAVAAVKPDPHRGLVLLAGHGHASDPALPPGRFRRCGDHRHQFGDVGAHGFCPGPQWQPTSTGPTTATTRSGRKSADGTGSVETLVSAGIVTPNRIAVDGNSYVYWADTGNDTIKRVPQTYGSFTVATLADSSRRGEQRLPPSTWTGATYIGRTTATTRSGSVATHSGPTPPTTLVSSGLVSSSRLGGWDETAAYVYVLDRNGVSSTIKRVEVIRLYTR